MLDKSNIINVDYIGQKETGCVKSKKSLAVIGVDTEADKQGNCFMLCTSEGDVFTPDQIPACFFGRKYRSKIFVAYNLKYDESAILKLLPLSVLQELRETGRAEYNNYIYHFIAFKFLSIRHNKHTVTFYDLLSFYGGSLDANAKYYLNKSKIEMNTKSFTRTYIKQNWNKLAEYCIYDAKLCKELADHLIKTFESYGVYPKKLYSTAYVTYQYFREQCKYVTVYDLWHKHRGVLDYAMHAYNGGKFEITRKCYDYLYEYDIVSAYPYEIANLVDISSAYVASGKTYMKDAVYGFIDCTIVIPYNIYSPVPVKVGQLCLYPVGKINKVITKSEYEYLISVGCDITIHNAYWLLVDKLEYPYRTTVRELVREKQKYRDNKNSLNYHTVKILLNSLYGKFVQLVPKGERWQASTCWNPIYGAVITANTRIKVSRMQQQYKHIVAVHTDSIITTDKMPIEKTDTLGDFSYDREGQGIVLGCGVYQIGKTTKLRGFHSPESLIDLCKKGGKKISIKNVHVESWKEAAWRGHNPSAINVFKEISKDLTPNFDKKRIWEKDYQTFDEVFERSIDGLPIDGEFLQLSFNTR